MSRSNGRRSGVRELQTLVPYLRPYRRGFAAGLLLVVVGAVFRIASPRFLGLAIDAVARPDATGWRIAGYASLVVLAALLGGAATFGMRQLLNGLSRRVEADLRDRFFEKLLSLDATFYARNRTGDLMSRATNDTQAVRMAAGPALMYLVNTLATTAFALAVMLRISTGLTLVSLLPLVALAPLMLVFGRIIHRRFERIQEQFAELSTLVQENLSGARIVRAYVQEEAQEREFAALNAAYMDRNLALARTSGLFHPSLNLLGGIGMLAVLWVGGRQVMAGSITVGDFVAFGIYLSMLMWPMIALGWVINLFQRGAASMGRINRILDARPEVEPPAQPVRLPAVRGEIEFRDVRFRYPGSDRDVLRGVSFHVPAGATVALVGPTGSGKSTIVSLLARLHDPTEGEIRLDGVPLTELATDQLRGALGVVPQDAFVFSDTLAYNIAFGLEPDAGRDGRIRDAARIARLDETVASFPAGYETRLGERGINLSGGQRQRATLARAIARDPRVLVLDDALSAVDTHTETEILAGLRRVLEGRTALIISHRVTAVMNADLILALDDGRIVERGTHAELVARGGLYTSLLHRQLIAEDLEREDDDAGEPAARASV